MHGVKKAAPSLPILYARVAATLAKKPQTISKASLIALASTEIPLEKSAKVPLANLSLFKLACSPKKLPTSKRKKGGGEPQDTLLQYMEINSLFKVTIYERTDDTS